MMPESSRAPAASDIGAPDTIDRIPALDGADITHTVHFAQDARRDILLGDCEVANAIAAAHLQVANTFLSIVDVERYHAAMRDFRDRVQVALRKANLLMEDARSSEVTKQAAVEYRQERDARRKIAPSREAA